MTKLCVSHPVPSCVTCGSPAVPIRHYYDQDRNRTATSYRRYCSKCHGTRTAKKHGFKRLSQIAAHRAGQTETQYKISGTLISSIVKIIAKIKTVG